MRLLLNLSQNLRALRGPKTQVEFSSTIGVTKSTLQAIEAQRTAPRLDTLEHISSNLKIPIGLLLDGDLTPEDVGILVRVLDRLEWFVALPPESQAEVLDWLQQTIVMFAGLKR